VCCDFPVVDLEEVVYSKTDGHLVFLRHGGKQTAPENDDFLSWNLKTASVKENKLSQ
jgi:hypothetical protein